MKKTQLYLLAFLIALAGMSAIIYKWKVLSFPLQPAAEVEVWSVQARIEYQPRRGANKVSLLLPADPPGFTILDERFIARSTHCWRCVRGSREAMDRVVPAASGAVLPRHRRARSVAVRCRVQRNPAPGRTGGTGGAYACCAICWPGARRFGRHRTLRRSWYGVHHDNPVGVALSSAWTLMSVPFLTRLLTTRHIGARGAGWSGRNPARRAMLPWLQVHNGVRWVTSIRSAAEGWPRSVPVEPRRQPDHDGGRHSSAQISYSVAAIADAMAVANAGSKSRTPTSSITHC